MTTNEKRWVGGAITILYVASVIGFTVTMRLQNDLEAEVAGRLGQVTIIARDRCEQVNDVAVAVKEAIRIVTVNPDASALRDDLRRLRAYGEAIKLRDCNDLPGVDGPPPALDTP